MLPLCPALDKMSAGASLTLQFALKLHNVEDDQLTYIWNMEIGFTDISSAKLSLGTGVLAREDGWLSVEVSGIVLPDLAGVDFISIKVEGDPAVDFLIDNVSLFMDI